MNEQNLKLKRERHQKILFVFFSAFKNAKLYSAGHPSAQESAERMVAALKDVFFSDLEISIQQSEGLYRIQEECFVEESLTLYDLLRCLENAKIERILFLPGVLREEVEGLINFLLALKSPVTELPSLFSSPHIRIFPEQDTHLILSHRERTSQRISETCAVVESWIHRTESLFNQLLAEQHFSPAEIGGPLEDLDDSIRRNPSLHSMAFASQKSELFLAHHAVRTMVLSLYLGQQLNLDMATQKVLGISALLHDIGRALLPSDFSSGSKLAASDHDFIRLHAKDGATFLAGVHGIPIRIIRVAFEHHIGFDGLGYPLLPSGIKPHILSQIVGLADFVSWQTISEHYYHRPQPLYRVVRSLLRRSGSQFDPILVKLLLPFLGLFPTGTKVLLSNGQTAVSLEPNIRNIHRPAVAILPPEKSEYKWLSEVDANGFALDVVKPLGEQADIQPLFSLIPTLFQSNT